MPNDRFAAELQARINTAITLRTSKFQRGLIIAALESEIAQTEHELEGLKEGTADYEETAQACDDLRELSQQLEEAFRAAN